MYAKLHICFRKSGFIVALTCCVSNILYSQVNYYSFTQSNTPYEEISAGVILGDNTNTGHGLFLDPDTTAIGYQTSGPGFDIGFDFVYRGITYDRFGVANNGWIFLGQSIYDSLAVDIGSNLAQQPMIDPGPENDTLRSRIAGFNVELQGNGSTSQLMYALLGTAPDRTLVIQWKSYTIYSNFFFPDSEVNFQIQLSEADQDIEIHYGDLSFQGVSNFTAQVGLSGLSFLEFNARTTMSPHDWNNTSPSTSHLDACAIEETTITPSNGLIFHYTPANCVPPMDVVLFDFTTSSLSFTWQPPYTDPNEGYEYALTQSPVPPSSGTTLNLDSIHLPGLMAGTSYFLHIRTKCSSSSFSEWLTFPSSTLCDPLPLPFAENFDGVTIPDLPNCFRAINLNPESNTLQTTNDAYMSPPNSLGFQCSNYIPEDDWFFTPGFEFEEDSTYIISLDFLSGDSLFVFAGESPMIAGMEVIDTFNFINEFTSRYALYTCTSTDTFYFGFYLNQCTIRLDDLQIKKYDCKVPMDVLVTENTGDTVLISWTTPIPMPAEYEYELMESVQFPPTSISSTPADSILFTDLIPSKDYYLFIRSSCGAGEFSPWVLYTFTTVPLNDECTDAIELTPDSIFGCSLVRYSTVGATDSGIPPDSCGGIPDDDVWFKFIATHRSHRVFVRPFFYESRPGSRTATSGEAYTFELYADSCGGTFMNCLSIPSFSQGEEIIRTDLIIGNVYYVRVFGTYEYIGGSDFDICIGTIAIEPNDDCSTAELLVSNGTNCENYATANLAGTTPSTTPGSSCDGAPFYDIWYKFAAIDTTQIVEVHFSNDGDGALQAFTGDCNNLMDIGCINDTIDGLEVMFLNDLVIGDSVFVRVFDAAGEGAYMETQTCIRVPHPNDECERAISISTVSGVTFHDPTSGNTMGATGNQGCGGFFADDDLWYKFIAEADTHLIIIHPDNYPEQILSPVIEWYEGGCGSTSSGCSDTGDLLATGLIPGNEYYFKVYSALQHEGQGSFLLSITIPPTNYTCSAVQYATINTGTTCADTIAGSTIGAGINNEVWYAFVAIDSSLVVRANYLSGNSEFYINFFEDCDSLPLAEEYIFSQAYYKHFIVGDTYYIRISSPIVNTFYYQGTFSLCLSHALNDECAQATSIIPGQMCETAIEDSFLGATPSFASDSCFSGGVDVWYQFTALTTYHEIEFSTETGSLLAQGELYKDSCHGEFITCFTYNPYYITTTNVYLDDLIPGTPYYIRVRNITSFDSSFTICISTPPRNDDCSQPVMLELPLVSHCTIESSAEGTTINGTNPNDDQPNVWYGFQATTTQIAIYVTPSTPGFDPAIRLWKQQSGGGAGDVFCTNGPFIKYTDITHADGQPEVMTFYGLSLGAFYLIEVCGGVEATAPGDFSICMSALNSAMKIHSVDYKTYDVDSVATAGRWQQPVVKITLRMSGTTVNKRLTKVTVKTIGTTQPSDIKMVRLYIDTSAIILFGDPVESTAPFYSFGEPSTGIGGHSPPVLFGQAVPNPNGTITFSGQFTMRGGVNTNYNRDLYLVYDIKCDATPGNIVNGTCTSLTIGNETYTPFQRANEGLPIQPLNKYDTQQNGDWNTGNTWMCNVPPPDGPDIFPISINHQVTVSGTQQCSDLMVNYLRSLTINAGSEITLGASSIGSQTGYSNKHFDCTWGSLSLQNSILTVNGSIRIGDHVHPGVGIFQAANSTLNVDGNDGTLEGSAIDNLFNLNVPAVSTENFNINILDPAFHDGNDFVYWGNSDFGENLHGTLKFGGGDDTNPTSDELGFYVSYGPGTFLRPDSLIIDGGLAISKRNVSGLFVAAQHMKVTSGSEFIGSIVLNGDLINNGLITIPAGREISFCGEADFANYYTNNLTSQSLSGTGFFRSNINDPIPLIQTDNQIDKLQVANTFSGLTLEMPLGIKNILRIRKGKINITDTSLLTLGDSLQPGILVTVDTSATEDPWKYYETPFSGTIKTWDGGFVDGPFRRWFQDTTSGEPSIFPVGTGDTKHPLSVTFVSLDTGYITAQFIGENPGPDGMPLINEQGVDLNNVSPSGYWNITSSGLTDDYDLAVNANGFTLDEDSIITDLTNLRLIKRPDNGAWNYSGSTYLDAPLSLDSISLPAINGFSDFAIGLLCNLVVTTANDSGPGSLRYIIEECANANDTIKFASNIQLLFITTDTIVLDKNLFIFNNTEGQVVIQTNGMHSTFSVSESTTVHMKDLEIHSGTGADGRAIWNEGQLLMENIIIRDTQNGGSAVYNKGNLVIIGNTEIRNE